MSIMASFVTAFLEMYSTNQKETKDQSNSRFFVIFAQKFGPNKLPIGFGSNSNLVSMFEVQDLRSVRLSLMFRFEAAQSLLSIFGFNPTLIQGENENQ